jgi:hypothetical protein
LFKRGVSPSFRKSSPSPLRERGIKGMRVINNLVLISPFVLNFALEED